LTRKLASLPGGPRHRHSGSLRRGTRRLTAAGTLLRRFDAAVPPVYSRPMSTDELHDQLQHALGGSYTIERELGGGGMSRVFLAEETRLGRKVVIKLLSPQLAAGVSAQRFEQEILLAAALQQANI